MERYSRRNHSQRHYRVARREAIVSPQAQMVKIKKKAPKFVAAGIAILLLMCVKWFLLGFFTGRKAC